MTGAAALMQAMVMPEQEANQDEAIGDLPKLPSPGTCPAFSSAGLLPLQGLDHCATVRCKGVKVHCMA